MIWKKRQQEANGKMSERSLKKRLKRKKKLELQLSLLPKLMNYVQALLSLTLFNTQIHANQKIILQNGCKSRINSLQQSKKNRQRFFLKSFPNVLKAQEI